MIVGAFLSVVLGLLVSPWWRPHSGHVLTRVASLLVGGSRSHVVGPGDRGAWGQDTVVQPGLETLKYAGYCSRAWGNRGCRYRGSWGGRG